MNPSTERWIKEQEARDRAAKEDGIFAWITLVMCAALWLIIFYLIYKAI